MRALILGLVLCSCASPRTKDCATLTPLLDEAKASRTLALGSKLADRPKRAGDAIRAVQVRDDAMKAPVFRLLDANDRYVAAMASLDELVTALRLTPNGTRGASDVQRAIEDARPHVERLVSRCWVIAEEAGPECASLRAALERCITPENDDITAEEQLLTCSMAVENVKTEDAVMVARTLRALEPFARNVGAHAREALDIAKKLAPKVGVQSAARTDAEKADAEIRALCNNP